MSFKVGDLVEIVSVKLAQNRILIGTFHVIESIGNTGLDVLKHRNDLIVLAGSPGVGRFLCPEQLRKIEPPANYDGNQAGDWELCPFQPYRQKERA
jgi:hypothetical protein